MLAAFAQFDNDVRSERTLAGMKGALSLGRWTFQAPLGQRIKRLVAELASLRPVPRLAPAVIENRLAEWRRLLRGSTTQGRAVLQPILHGRLTFTPRLNPLSGEPDGDDFAGPTRFDKLFTGIAVETPAWIKASSSRNGFEDTTPEDTFDGDYGRLLDQTSARVKGGVPDGVGALTLSGIHGV